MSYGRCPMHTPSLTKSRVGGNEGGNAAMPTEEGSASLLHSQGKGRRRLGFPQQPRKSLSILMRH